MLWRSDSFAKGRSANTELRNEYGFRRESVADFEVARRKTRPQLLDDLVNQLRPPNRTKLRRDSIAFSTIFIKTPFHRPVPQLTTLTVIARQGSGKTWRSMKSRGRSRRGQLPKT